MRTILLKLASLLFILCCSVMGHAQTVTTTAGSVNQCPGEAISPVTVTGFNGVGAFSMVLLVNPSILDYTGYQDVNPALNNGVLVINEENGSVYLSWHGYAAASITDGSVLVKLVFTGSVGTTSLTWDTQTA